MVPNGYAELHPISLKVRADTLETISGYPDEERIDRELAFAIATTTSDVDSLRWLAALCAAKVEYLLDAEAKERATCSVCLSRTYRSEECVCENEEGDAEVYEEVLQELGVDLGDQ